MNNIIRRKKSTAIPLKIIINGKEITDVAEVLKRWQNDFKQLFNTEPVHNETDTTNTFHTQSFSKALENVLPMNVSEEEVRVAIFSQKNNKSCGYDNIYAEVLKNEMCVTFFTVLFSYCLKNNCIPSQWKKG